MPLVPPEMHSEVPPGLPPGFPAEPLISVVMPVYNAEQFVGPAMESILCQTYSHFELIVVDDGSGDGSRAVIEALARHDARVRPLAVTHGGQSAALNAGIAAARGHYVALMDADDLALPERLAVQLAYLRRTRADLCGACVQCFGSEHRVLWFPEDHAAIRSEMLFRCAVLPSTVLVRADILQANTYLPGVVFQDYELWTRLVPQYKLANCPQVLVQYRCHSQQVSRRQKMQNQNEMEVYRCRYFFALYPEATQEDFGCFTRLALRQAHPTLADLESAGTWLIRVSHVPDAFVRKRSADRWFYACSRSAALGLACLDLYREMAQEFGEINPRSVHKLRLRCLLHLAAGSRLEKSLQKCLRNFFFKKRNEYHAAA